VTERQPTNIPTLKIDLEPERQQKIGVMKLRQTRDKPRAAQAIEGVRRAALGDENLMVAVIEAARSDVTLQEVSDVFREVWGEHRDPAYL
jgi:methylmalonyl-CoA mutase N-terminal domain/subunit